METRPLLLGHRGARGKAFPENTLAAFDFALASGCDGFEFDVRLAADAQGIICHDPRSRGIEVARSPAGNLSLPSLGDVLSRYQTTAVLDIELKVLGLENIIAGLLQRFPPARGCVVSSFLPAAIEALRKIDSTVPLGLICETRDQLSRWTDLPVEYVIPNQKLVSREFVTKAKAAGKRILVWTVNRPADMRRIAGLGVDGIISDHPIELTRTLASETNRA